MGSEDPFTASLLFLLCPSTISKQDVCPSSHVSGSGDTPPNAEVMHRRNVRAFSHVTVLHVPLAEKSGADHFISGLFDIYLFI